MDIFSLHPDSLIKPKVVANTLHVDELTLTKWRCIGRENIPYIKIGRCVRYRVSDILKYIEESRVACEGGK